MPPEILTAIFFAIGLYLVFYMCRAGIWAERLIDNERFYINRMKSFGIIFRLESPGNDSAPIEMFLKFTSEDGRVCIERGVTRGYRLIKRINAGDVTLEDCVLRSDYPSVPLPKI